MTALEWSRQWQCDACGAVLTLTKEAAAESVAHTLLYDLCGGSVEAARGYLQLAADEALEREKAQREIDHAKM